MERRACAVVSKVCDIWEGDLKNAEAFSHCCSLCSWRGLSSDFPADRDEVMGKPNRMVKW